MKIGIIGASGKAGSLIAAEAKQRGHEVTAIVRNAARVEGKGYAVLEKDLFMLTAEDLRDFDVVIDAFGTANDEQRAQAHQTSLAYLTALFKSLPGRIRLIVVGGAASLFTGESKQQLVLELIPEEARPVPVNMMKAFEKLKTSTINWTFFSPAAFFDPAGGRTGRYTLGTDYMILNSARESYISYADYAVAMVDEAEYKRFERRRFTAVSERTQP